MESIFKENPAGQTTAAIGVPFTYSLTAPEMYDPWTETYIGGPSISDLHSVRIWDDLSRTVTAVTDPADPSLDIEGADLTWVATNATYYNNTAGTSFPITLVPETVADPGGKYPAWSNKTPSYQPYPLINAGDQIVVEFTVVLDDTPANVPGDRFVNWGQWEFGISIWLDDNRDGIDDPTDHNGVDDGPQEYKFYDPLPGQSGVTEPMTIVAPDLIVSKTSAEAAINLGTAGNYTIDVENNGGGAAWNATILDQLPLEMCANPPTAVTAQVIAADGFTITPLTVGTDYSVTFRGESPPPGDDCQLELTMLSAAAVIEPLGGRLVISYQSELDTLLQAHPPVDGQVLINVAGAIQWYNGPASASGRIEQNRSLSDGTPATPDHEDSEDILAGLSGYYFQKLVANLTTGQDQTSVPAGQPLSASAGDTLRYSLHLFNLSETVNNISISDILSPTWFDTGSFVLQSTLPVGLTPIYDAGTGTLTISGSPIFDLGTGNNLLVEFDITLLPTLANGLTVPNQAVLISYDDLGNSRTTPSDDSFVNGLANPLDDPYEPESTDIVIANPGPLTKVAGQASATIGEEFTYTITVPATPMARYLYDVRILDDLSGIGADLTLVSVTDVSSGFAHTWVPVNISTDPTVLEIAAPATGGIDIPPDNQAVIEVTLRLANTDANNLGGTFTNTATYTYNNINNLASSQTNGEAGVSGPITILEPVVTASKVGTQITPAPPADLVGGGIIEYQVTMVNSGTSTAHDVNLVDNLPPELALLAIPPPTAEIVGGPSPGPVAGFVATPTIDAVSGQLTWGRGNGDGSLDIPVGASLLLTYQAQVVVTPVATFNNEVGVDWTSLDTASVGERTGIDCLAGVVGPNDYCATAVTPPFTIVDNNSLSKAITSDSWNPTGSTVDDATVRIGDTATYELSLNLGEGSTSGVTVTDVLPAGLELVGPATITPSDGAPFTYSLIAQPGAGDSGTLVWDFGDIVNLASNDGTPVDQLVIQYTVRVVEDTLAQAATTTLTNTATLAYLDGVGNPVVDPTRLVASDDLIVLQPVMEPIVKTGNGASNDATTPLNVNVASDTVLFQVETCNSSGLAPAYNLTISDTLAPELDEGSIAGFTVAIDGTDLTPANYTYTAPAARGGTMTVELAVPVDPGQCVTIDYEIGFYTDFPANSTWNNSATINDYWSLAGDTGQQYLPTETAHFFMTNLAGAVPMSKVVATPASGEITIGEDVVYTITVPAITTYNAVLSSAAVTDTLPPELVYVSASATATFAGFTLTDSTVGQDVDLALGDIPANGQVTITLTARLANNSSTNAGVTFSNTATFTATDLPDSDGDGTPDVVTATSGDLLIVEPLIAITKAVAPVTAPNPGDTLTYTLTLTASDGGNFSDAFDLTIEDDLSLGLAYVAGSATVDGAGLADPTVSGDGVATAQRLVWDLAGGSDIDVAEAATVIVTYDVLVINDGSVAPGQELSNSALARWTGLDDGHANEGDERDGSETPVENDYFTGPETTTLITQAGPLAKTIVSSHVNDEVAIGEAITYRITVPAVAQTTELDDVRIIDDLNTMVSSEVDLTFVSVAKISTFGTWLPGNTSGDDKNLVIEDVSGTGGIDIPAGEQAVIEVTVVVDDSADNISGTVFNNTADYTYNLTEDPGQPGTSGDLTIVGPDNLVMDKTGPLFIGPGVPETFSLDLHNPGTGAAWNPTVTDILPPEMCGAGPANVTLAIVDGAITTPLTETTHYSQTFSVATCRWTVALNSNAGGLPADGHLLITYEAELVPGTANGLSLTNVAGATSWYSTNPAGAAIPRNYTETLTDGSPGTDDFEDNHVVTSQAPILLFAKSVVNFTSGLGPLAGLTASPGDTLRYTLELTNNGPVALTGAEISDEVDRLNGAPAFAPNSLVLQSNSCGGTETADPLGGASGTGLLTVTGLTVPAVGSCLIVFDVDLAATLTDATLVRNQAQLDYGVVTLLDSDDPIVGGLADPAVLPYTPDTTDVTIVVPGPLTKVSDRAEATIGEEFTYTITVPDAPATSPLYDVRVLDDLSLSGADLTFVSATLESSGSLPLTNSGTPTNLILGDTENIDIPVGGQAVIAITVALANTTTNDIGDTFSNRASYTYNRGDGDPATEVVGSEVVASPMTVLEPQLTVTKTTSMPTLSVVGGSTIDYTVTMVNSGTSTAHDVNVLDNLPPELALLTSPAPSATIGGTPVAGFISTPTIDGATGQLTWGRDNGDESLDIPAGATLVLTYQAQVVISSAATFYNEVWVDWTSLAGVSASERTGTCPTPTAPDDYCATAIGPSFDIVDSNSLSKAIIADSWTTDGSSAVDQRVRIGDSATYQLTLALGEGTTSNVTVTDLLPAGLELLSFTVTPASGASSFTYSLTAPANTTGTLVWDFGDIVNAASNDGTPVDQLVIEYVAQVVAPSALAQQPSTSLTNTATMAYDDGAGIPVVDPARLEASADLTLEQPVMAVPVKTGRLATSPPPGTTNDAATALNVNVVSDRVHFQVESCNSTGLAPAYNLTISDSLDSNFFDLASITALEVRVGGTLLAAGDYTYTDPVTGGGTMTIELADTTPVLPGDCLTVDYEIGFVNTIAPNETWSNNATVTDYWSLPGDSGQQYASLGPAQFYMTNIVGAVAMSKVLTSPLSGEATIGEEVIYTITIPATPIAAALTNVVVSDSLDPVLHYDDLTAERVPVSGANVVLAPVVTVAGQDLSIEVGDIAAGEQVIITLTTWVDNNVSANAGGDSFSNTASFVAVEQVTPVTATSAPLTIVEPLVTIGKSVVLGVDNDGNGLPNPGDILTYTLTLTASSGPDFTDAYDLTIEDTLGSGLLYVGGSAQVNGTGVGDPDIAGQLLVWSPTTTNPLNLDIAEGASATVSYQVEVQPGVLPGQLLTNSALARWTSLDGSDVKERYGTDDPLDVNDYVTGPVTAIIATQAGALLKEVVIPAAPDTEVAIGEEITYRIIVPAVPQATALNDVRILDDLTASAVDLTLVSFTKVATVPGSINTGAWVLTNSGDSKNLILEDSSGLGIDIPANEQAVIEVTVVVDNSAANFAASGTSFTNTAGYTYAEGPGLDGISPPLTLVGPDNLVMTKTGPATIALGSLGAFSLDLHNPSSATAWNPTILDRLPPEMCGAAPVIGTVEILDGALVTVATLAEGTGYSQTFDATSCEWTVQILSAAGGLEADHHLSINYTAGLVAGTADGLSLTNVAGVTSWYSADPAVATDAHNYTEILTDGTPGVVDDTQDLWTLVTQAPVLELDKRVINLTSGLGPVAGLTANPGDRLRYTLEVRNTSAVPLPSFAITDEVDRLNGAAWFAPGTLSLVSAPAGATVTLDGVGGVNGTGLLQVADLAIGANATVTIEFDVTLAPVIPGGSVVVNQAQLDLGGGVLLNSDEPLLGGAEDPTPITIVSAPLLTVTKSSQDISGDPLLLLPGDTLAYTITVANVGNEDGVNVSLSDLIPTNTSYVAGSTTLNGAAVADSGPGISPLQDGMLIATPGSATPGTMAADPGGAGGNVATITFQVTVNSDVLDGTIISNQGFVTGSGSGSGPFVEQPSDDPDTAVVDDPTEDVVGSMPLLDAQKTVVMQVDNNGDTVLSPGDVLRYTIVISNSGQVPATGVTFSDSVPVGTSYVAGSTSLNGLAVADAAGPASPLIAGIPVSSSDLTPPLPGVGGGIVSPGASATITFDVLVDAGLAAGTVISNQGMVASVEMPDEPTDSDGIDSNGDQPTLITVGDSQLVAITKQVFVVGGGTAEPGSELEYQVQVTNNGTVPAAGVVVSDDLAPLISLGANYVAGSAQMAGSTAGVSYAGTILTADYGATYGTLAPGATFNLRFRVLIDPAVPIGTTLSNTALVSWDSPVQTAPASVDLGVGGTPGRGAVNGRIWYDAGLDNVFDSGELPQEGWLVEVFQGSSLVTSSLSDVDGLYRLSGLLANDLPGSLPYELRFTAPGAGPNTASLGTAHSPFTNGIQQISDIVIATGANLPDLNLPLWPNGVVYNSVAREPVAGATLVMQNAATRAPLPAACFDDPAQQNQVTLASGFYKFAINFSDPVACPAGGNYLIAVTPPATGYINQQSRVIVSGSDATTAPYSIPVCPNDAVAGGIDSCQAAPSALMAPVDVAPNSAATTYYLHLTLNDDPGTVPENSQPFQNHIPLDPELESAVAITKTSSALNVSKGALVPYTITVNNIYGVPLYGLSIVDLFPAGFKYVAGSARLNDVAREPVISGRVLRWDGLDLQVNQRYVIRLLLVVGAGVTEGEYINRAQVLAPGSDGDGAAEAQAVVAVVADPDLDCTDIIGKVFDDRDLNGWQEGAETGIGGVRVVTARGLIVTSDEHGRFHITCAAVPDEDRGSNFILKVDERSLPSGFRLTTENPRVQRLTRGKMARFNFGATIHRIVRLDIAAGVFEPDTTELRPQWQGKIVQLLTELGKGPAVLRLSYLADIEDEDLVEERLETLQAEISRRWLEDEGGYRLDIEQEIFWRRGGPMKGGR
ncbi:MAG: isopeptide-forming domain-containing fimbrial protein [Thermodesulfobacteriota bacterium]